MPYARANRLLTDLAYHWPHGGIVQGIGQAVIRRCSVTSVSSLSIEIERPVQAVLPLVAQLEHV
jgi:hypothetical protein